MPSPDVLIPFIGFRVEVRVSLSPGADPHWMVYEGELIDVGTRSIFIQLEEFSQSGCVIAIKFSYIMSLKYTKTGDIIGPFDNKHEEEPFDINHPAIKVGVEALFGHHPERGGIEREQAVFVVLDAVMKEGYLIDPNSPR